MSYASSADFGFSRLKHAPPNLQEVFAADNLSDSTTRHPDTQGRKSNTLDYNGPAVQTAGKSNVHSANTVDPHAVRGGKELFDPSVTEGASARHPDTQKDLTDTT